MGKETVMSLSTNMLDYLQIIAIISDTSSDNSNSDSDSTSQIRTSEETDYSSLEYKGPPKNISKAKAFVLAKASESSLKAKVQESRSKAKVKASMAQASPKPLIFKSPVPITNCVIGFANAKTWDAILSKTFGAKIPQLSLVQKKRKGRGRLKGEAEPFNVFWYFGSYVMVLM
uniref:Uncharacterized protein n=1 Tax=Tanacetum cinerariifolium TaxID=118510 RepID=A0A699IDG9_TANCI|nr:hypothetical protein [Tanacetum cinerariifolium]